MEQKWEFQKGVKLYLDEGTTLRILFEDGKTKQYDMSKVFDKLPSYKALEDRKFFLKGKLNGPFGVVWSKDIDMSVDVVYYHGDEVKSEDNSIQYIIGFKVKQARLHKELSQADLSKLTGIDQSSISKLEKGKFNPSIKILQKIFKALDKDISFNILDNK